MQNDISAGKVIITGDTTGAVAAIKEAQASLAKLGVIAKDSEAGIKAMSQTTTRSVSAMSAGWNALKNAAAGYLGLNLAKSVFEQTRAFSNLEFSLRGVFGSQEQANQQFAYLSTVSEKLGLSLQDAARGYLGIASAAKNTSIEGDKARAIFEGFSGAMAQMGRSSEQISSVMLQLTQAISKNSLQWEDLRVLQEQFPGINQRMAAALGLTDEAFIKLVHDGGVTRDVLARVGESMQAGVGRVDNLEASVSRLQTQWQKLLASIGNVEAFSSAIEKLTGLIKIIGDFTEANNQALKSIGGVKGLYGDLSVSGSAGPMFNGDFAAWLANRHNQRAGLGQFGVDAFKDTPPAAAAAAGQKIANEIISPQIVADAAKEYGVRLKLLEDIIRMESGGNINAINLTDENFRKGTPSRGAFQFIQPTFESFYKQAAAQKPALFADMGGMNWLDPRQQAFVAAWAFANNKGSHWTTFSKLGKPPVFTDDEAAKRMQSQEGMARELQKTIEDAEKAGEKAALDAIKGEQDARKAMHDAANEWTRIDTENRKEAAQHQLEIEQAMSESVIQLAETRSKRIAQIAENAQAEQEAKIQALEIKVRGFGQDQKDQIAALEGDQRALYEARLQQLNAQIPGGLSDSARADAELANMARASQGLIDFENQAHDTFSNVSGYAASAMLGIQRSIADTLLQGVGNWKDFGDAVLNILKQFVANVAASGISELLAKLVGVGIGQSGSYKTTGGGIIGGLASLAGLFFHGGGEVGKTVNRRTMNALAHNEVLAVLQKGEIVLTRHQALNVARAGALPKFHTGGVVGGGPGVSAITSNSSPVTTINVSIQDGNVASEVRGDSGRAVDLGRMIDASVKQILARESRPGGVLRGGR